MSRASKLPISLRAGRIGARRDVDANRRPGSGAPSHRFRSLGHAALTLLVACLAVAFLAPAARAYSPVVHPFVTDISGFTHVRGVAADDSGHVYVSTGFPENVIRKFDTAGNPVNFSGLGTNEIPGVSLGGRSQIAVDNSGGVADGDIYVAGLAGTPRNRTVEIYGADGTFQGALSAAGDITGGGAFRPTGGVAVDPDGKVYVANGSNTSELIRYIPSANPPTNSDFDALLLPRGIGANLAADSAGAVFWTSALDGLLRKFAADQFSGGRVAGEVFSFDAQSVAVDPEDDDVYVARASEVAVFDHTGEPRGIFGTGHVDQPTGVAVNSAGNVFVANSATGTVSIFGPALTLPDVSGGSADAVTTNSATLHGAVDPTGIAVGNCQFEYGLTTAYGQTATCQPSPGSGSGKVDVSAAISSLDPATTYHFRLVATNANGTTEGNDHSFDTAGVPGITRTRVAGTSQSSAVVSARINPHFAATDYRVQYGADSTYGQSTAVTPLGSSDGKVHAASARLTGLTAGATYHFRFVATNAYGTTRGPDRAFGACNKPRTVLSAALPDCRAYEQVSPVDKGHSDVASDPTSVSSPDGSNVTFTSSVPFPGSTSGQVTVGYAASRGTSGWSTNSISPRTESQWAVGNNDDNVYGGSADFTKLMVSGHTALTPGAVDANTNFYAYDTTAQSYELIDTASPFAYFGLSFAGAPTDGSSFVYSESAFFVGTPSTPPADPAAFKNLYQWSSAGGLQLVGVMPNDDPSPSGSTQAGYELASVANHVVSADGTRIYWTHQFGSGPVYLRDGNDTKVVSADQSDVKQNATFWQASADGSKAFITSNSPLTTDASPAGADLYRYDADADQLTDLTPNTDPGGADVIGVFGASEDGDYVYFAAKGALAPGATAGEANIYVWHAGDNTRFIGALATHADEVTGDIASGGGRLWQVSPDGRGFGLLFRGEITGPDPQPGYALNQAYLYSFDDDSLACASCPDDRAPRGEATFARGSSSGDPVLGRYASSLQVATNDGRLFFNTTEPLVPADVNGEAGCASFSGFSPGDPHCLDVYEYVDGEAHLISTGRSSEASMLASVSSSGNDVFFYTYEALVGQDNDNNNDIYDARVGGGLASQNPPPPEPACKGDGCQAEPSSAPELSNAGSSKFVGPADREVKKRDCKAAKKKVKRARKRVRRAERTGRHGGRGHKGRHAGERKGRHVKRKRAGGGRASHRTRKARHKVKQAKRKLKRARKQAKRCKRGTK